MSDGPFYGQAIASGVNLSTLMAHVGSRDRAVLRRALVTANPTQEMIIRRSIYAREECCDGVRGQSASISQGIKD